MDQQGSLAPDFPVLDGVKFTGTVQVQERAAEGPLTWSFSTEKAFVATLSSVGWGVGRHRNCDGRFLPSMPHL